MSAPPSSRTGWPIRRQARCYGFETGHHTWDKYWSCCPPHTEEFIDKDSKTYCYLDDTAKDKDLESPAMKAAFPSQCANSTQVLWAYDGNYFCCEDSLTGFVNEWVSLGCAPEEEVRVGEDNELMWGADLKGQPDVLPTSFSTTLTAPLSSETSKPDTSATSTSPSSGEPSATSASTSSSSSSSSSSTNKGAIAGGVVGGVVGALAIVGIIWFLMRLRKRRLTGASQADNMPATAQYAGIFDTGNTPKPGYGSPSELGGGMAHEDHDGRSTSRPPYELPVPTPAAVAPHE